MFIPLRTDRRPRRRPVVTETIIVINLLVYLAGLVGVWFDWFDIETFIATGQFDPLNFHVWQLITSQFLHDPYGLGHLGFNMLFLWVFGCPVEDRFGRLGFALFYLAGGSVAALAHWAVNPASPAIGASGSISAVVGAFLALFPRSRIRVLLIFFIIGIYHIPSLWFIGLYFLLDVLNQTAEWLGGSEGGVAYMAHIAGHVFGFAIAFALLATGLLTHEDFDIFFLFKQARRRSAFRKAAQANMGGVWDAPAADTDRLVHARSRRAAPPSPEEARIAEARADISRLLARHRLPEAAAAYRRLLAAAPQSVFPEPRQLDLANQLYAEEQFPDAATAYERFLARYASSRHTTEVRLILALIYGRRLDEPQRARALLEEVRPRLRDAAQTALADDLLQELTA